jgi:hypothetical protein
MAFIISFLPSALGVKPLGTKMSGAFLNTRTKISSSPKQPSVVVALTLYLIESIGLVKIEIRYQYLLMLLIVAVGLPPH